MGTISSNRFLALMPANMIIIRNYQKNHLFVATTTVAYATNMSDGI
jgi:hypothetical protein